MFKFKKSEWFTLLGLLGLSLVPCVGGVFRMIELGLGTSMMPENPRVIASPLPVVLHVISVVPYCVLGILQFLPTIRQRYPKWHRSSGYLLVVSGILSALSGLWMTQFYPFPTELQGPLLYGVRWIVGIAMIMFIGLGLSAIFKRRITAHRAWMIRAYALGQGAGTQVFVMIPWMLLVSEPMGLTRDLLMTFSWMINLLVSEIVISRTQRVVDSKRVQTLSTHFQQP